MLTFQKISRAQAPKILADRLARDLTAKKRVLWLVSGGSNIPITVKVLKRLPKAAQPYLAIMLSDERYGAAGHEDSNLRQLYDAGFAPGKATVVPMLLPEDLPMDAVAARYEAAIKTAFANADVIIAQLGIGADGHITGMLPGSPAITAKQLVVGYDAGQFKRITLTPKALKQITAAYVFAFGPEKRPALETLRAKKLPLAKQPAQILKQLPEAHVHSDQPIG